MDSLDTVFGMPTTVLGGGCLVLIGVYNFVIYAYRMGGWTLTKGVIAAHTARDEDNNFLVVFAFTDSNGARHRVKGNIGGLFGPPIGSTVPVCYNPANPSQAFVCNWLARYVMPGILVVLGLLLMRAG